MRPGGGGAGLQAGAGFTVGFRVLGQEAAHGLPAIVSPLCRVLSGATLKSRNMAMYTAWGGHRKAHQKALHVTHVCDLESMHVLPNQNLANWVVDSCGCSLNSR